MATKGRRVVIRKVLVSTKPGRSAKRKVRVKQPRLDKEIAGGLSSGNESKSGKVPTGDVRLTANVRSDLHLKLKIEVAKRRTTIGELIEELIMALPGPIPRSKSKVRMSK
jgi:hypothetical protein